HAEIALRDDVIAVAPDGDDAAVFDVDLDAADRVTEAAEGLVGLDHQRALTPRPAPRPRRARPSARRRPCSPSTSRRSPCRPSGSDRREDAARARTGPARRAA